MKGEKLDKYLDLPFSLFYNGDSIAWIFPLFYLWFMSTPSLGAFLYNQWNGNCSRSFLGTMCISGLYKLQTDVNDA